MEKPTKPTLRALSFNRSPEADLKRAVRKLIGQPDLVRRVLFETSLATGVSCSSPEAFYQVVRPFLWGQEDEHFAVVALDGGMSLIDSTVVSRGSAAFTVVDSRQVMRWLLTRDRQTMAFAVAHNHPSGVLTPSKQDHVVTSELYTVSKSLNIQFMDHLIVGGSKFYSMREGGDAPWTRP